MRTLGLLGGMSWHSTAVYYERIQRTVAAELGPYRSAPLVLHSMDYGELRQARADGEWRRFGRRLVSACRGLKRAGAEGVVICSNTIHRFAPQIESETGLEVLHIADAVIAEATRRQVHTVGLLGTAYTVSQAFYRDRLEAAGLKVLVSDAPTVTELNRILLDEVAAGELRDTSRATFVEAMATLRESGAEAMVLGCTEIGLLVGPDATDIPMIETATVHADYAADWAIGAP
ncbi:MAG: amino acid racemase [Proteobacteria bacterium]|nr:amino acid racemase [Pseudomonadota bacterium]